MGLLTLKSLLEQDNFSELSGVVAAAMERHVKDANERLGNMLVEVLGEADETVRHSVAILKSIRQQEKVAKDSLREITEAVNYLRQTGNPLPLYKATGNAGAARRFCSNLGVDVPAHDDPLWKIKSIKVEADAPQAV